MGDRCTGRCCEAFYIRHSVEEIAAYAQTEGDPNAADNAKIAAMILPIMRTDERTPAVGNSIGGALDDGWFYTCRHYDDSTGNCDAYEQRPSMCRDYPYGKRCQFSRCTWSKAHPVAGKSSDGRMRLVVLMSDDVRDAFEKQERELLAMAAKVRAEARQKVQVP